jgi:kumamolisin
MADPTDRFRLTDTGVVPPAGSDNRGVSDGEKSIQVTVILKPSPLPDDHPLAARHATIKGSVAEQRPALSRDDLEQIYSPDDAHVAAVQEFAAEHGLTVVRISRVRHDMQLEGPISRMNEAFGVSLEDFEHEAGRCRAHSGDIHLPDKLSNIVAGVLGLDDVPFSRSFESRGQVAQEPRTPLQLADIYNFPRATGRGYGIAILCFGDCGYYEADMRSFFLEVLGVEPPLINSNPVNGAKCNPLPRERLLEMTEYYKNKTEPSVPFTPKELRWGKETLETTMDIQVAGGVANGAAIDVYFAPDDPHGWYTAIYSALGLANEYGEDDASVVDRDLPAAISVSWGASEDRWKGHRMSLVDSALEKAELMHVTVCCSSGDFGSLNEPPITWPENAKVNFPASSRHTLACGGTSFRGESESGDTVETSWNARTEFGPEATGGGVSGIFELPDFQNSANVPAHDELKGKAWLDDDLPQNFTGRGVPDVSAYADVGFTIFVGGQTYVTGGTSASTPLWAGLMARLSEKLGCRVGWLNDFIYRPDFSRAFRPVTIGNNKLVDTGAAYFETREGWDGCCGLGVPNGEILLECLQKALSTAKSNG